MRTGFRAWHQTLPEFGTGAVAETIIRTAQQSGVDMMSVQERSVTRIKDPACQQRLAEVHCFGPRPLTSGVRAILRQVNRSFAGAVSLSPWLASQSFLAQRRGPGQTMTGRLIYDRYSATNWKRTRHPRTGD